MTTMEVTDFDAERPRLTAIAIRILGSKADADDILQETWLRLSRTDDIDDLPAWLTTVVTRLCLDQLRKRRTRSAAEAEAPADPAPVDPEADALLAEKMGEAMQVVLDALAPAERAAFVLHDVFGYPFDEISAVMGRSGTAVRQLASRARRKVQGVPEPAASQAASVPRATGSSTRFSPPPAAGILPPCCRSSLPTPSCAPTSSDSRWARIPSTTAQPPWPPASTAPGGRLRSPSMVSWVPPGSRPGRSRWPSCSMSRRAWCARSS